MKFRNHPFYYLYLSSVGGNSLCVCFFLQGTSITSTSSSTSLPMRSVSAWAGPPRLWCSQATLTSSAIRHGRISSQSSLEALVSLSCVACVCFLVFLCVCVSSHASFFYFLWNSSLCTVSECSLFFSFVLIQSAVTTRALVSPAMTGRASGPL